MSDEEEIKMGKLSAMIILAIICLFAGGAIGYSMALSIRPPSGLTEGEIVDNIEYLLFNDESPLPYRNLIETTSIPQLKGYYMMYNQGTGQARAQLEALAGRVCHTRFAKEADMPDIELDECVLRCIG